MTLLLAQRDRLAAILAVLAGLLLSACGGGDLAQPVTEKSFASDAIAWDSPAATAAVRRLALAASAAASPPPYGDALPNDAIEQLLNFGEASYAVYFPKHTETLTFQQYRYRYYADTGVYLGVADGSGGTVAGGVYVMGGAFGSSPSYVGALTSFITPYAVLHYQDVIFANSDLYGWYPIKLVLISGAISGEITFTAEKAINMTSFQFGEWPLFNCVFNRVKLKSGAIKLTCQDRTSGARHDLVWNPVTNRITEYDGPDGAYPVPSDATWVSAQNDTPPVIGWSNFAETNTGWVWNSVADWRIQHFKRKSDGVDVIFSQQLGVVKAFAAFSN